MKVGHGLLILALAVVMAAPAPAFALSPTPAAEGQGSTDPPPSPSAERQTTTTQASGSSIEASAQRAALGRASVPGAQQAPVSLPAPPPLSEYLRAEVCGVSEAVSGGVSPCPLGTVVDHSDVCGSAPVVLPVWHRTRTGVGAAWTRWVLVADVSCAGSPAPTGDQVLAAFRRLPIAASVVHVQPDRGWVLVNVDTIAYADQGTQVLVATVLGVQVRFVVVASSFTWDFGQGSFTTASAGHAYPDQDVAYRYRHLGTGSVRLVTTWSATYTTSADPTVRPVPGTATTTSVGPTFQVVEARSALTRGDCTQYPHDPGC